MADLARMAGVSTSTVSRALAGNALIPQAKRDEIARLARAHGYVPNIGARRLRLNRTEVIGVVIPLAHEKGQPISDPFFLELVGHLADAISSRGYDTLLTRVPSPEDGWLDRLLSSGRVDGLLVIGQSNQHDALNAAAEGAGAPMVVWGARRPNQRYVSVGVDNVQGARAAVAHLIASGRRRIAFAGASPLPEMADRLAGYEAALRDAGLDVDLTLRIETHLSGERLADPLMRHLADDPSIDAVVCATDVIAIAALHALSASGRSAPRDIAITGFDDIAAAALIAPSLTTVRQDLAEGGRRMVELLFAQLAGEAVQSVEMRAPLVVRDSSG